MLNCVPLPTRLDPPSPQASVAPTVSTAPDFHALRQSLARAVQRMCPGHLSDRADDLVQVAMMRVMDLMNRPGKEMNQAYLWRVAYSAMIDEIRRLRARGETSLEGDDVMPMPLAATPNPEQMTGGRQIGRHIYECLHQLCKDRRRAVTLYLQGHTVPEAARLLGFAPKKTENLVYRGLKELRTCLTARGITP